ncbi:hypothetical protein [Yoonia sediminilitoris]|uniref:Uncharacterized protein n=1 Tax=Yoonia sediminilitoris TaxID=1286148 RepID=A0A2T6KQR3_9RHOB|nr:hypothetical protein [Yoonia sediminilitoris]PUB18904.1 hypothetical protein C8N45_101495 [Yoonia sediminilitoris]RCW99072.1 hypothetical protein DFP92_101495 [Yoonia sediminilitoris]
MWRTPVVQHIEVKRISVFLNDGSRAPAQYMRLTPSIASSPVKDRRSFALHFNGQWSGKRLIVFWLTERKELGHQGYRVSLVKK